MQANTLPVVQIQPSSARIATPTTTFSKGNACLIGLHAASIVFGSLAVVSGLVSFTQTENQIIKGASMALVAIGAVGTFAGVANLTKMAVNACKTKSNSQSILEMQSPTATVLPTAVPTQGGNLV